MKRKQGRKMTKTGRRKVRTRRGSCFCFCFCSCTRQTRDVRRDICARWYNFYTLRRPQTNSSSFIVYDPALLSASLSPANRRWQRGSDIDTCCMMRIKDPPTPCQEHRQLSVCVHLLIMPISVSFLVVALFVFIPWFSLCLCVCVDSLVVFFFLKRCFLVKSCSLGVEGEQTGETLPR